MAQRRVGDYVLPVLVLLIIATGMSRACVAQAGTPTEMEKKARVVLTTGGGTEDAPPSWGAPIADAPDEPEPRSLPDPGDGDGLAWWQWLFMSALMASVLGLIVWLTVAIIVKYKSRQNAEAKKPPPPRCPVCDKPWEGEMVPFPRLVVPRRTFNFGRYQIILPEPEEEQQGVKGCPLCYEIAIALVRVEREKLMEQRATDRRAELEKLVEFQRGLSGRVKGLR